MKKKLFILSLLVVIGMESLASDRDDMKYIDKLYEAKEYTMATDELKSFVVTYPKSSYKKSALKRLAKTLYLNKEYKESITYFKEYLKVEGLDKEEIDMTHYYLARNNIYLKDYNTAKGEINKIDKNSPKKIDAVYYLGISYYENGDYENAKKTFNYLINKPTRSKDALLYISLSSYNNKEYVNSTIYLEEYLKGDTKGKNLELANYMYGMNQYKLGNYEDAIKRLSKVESEYPKSEYIDDVRLGLLGIYLSTESMDKVHEYYEKIESVEGQDKANTLLGNHYFSEKKYEISYEYYSKIKNLMDPKTIYGLAYSMHQVGEEKSKNENIKSEEAVTKTEDIDQGMSSKEMIAESRKYFEKLIGTSFDSEGIYYTTLIYFYEKNYSEIINSLKNYDEKKMKKEYRSNMDLFLGKSYYEMKNYTKAKEHYEKTYNRTQSKGDLYQLILVDSKIGNTNDIERRFNEYKQKFPTDLVYRQKIYLLVGNTYYKANQLEKAKVTYTEYLKSYSDSKISENYITILVAEGSYKELVTYLTPQPRTPENIYLMGIGYLGLTEYDKAIKEFENVIVDTHSTPTQREKANYNLVKANFANKKYNETINSAKKYLDNKEFKEYRLEILDLEGLANFRLENYDKARKIFAKLGESPKYKDYSKYQIAETYYNQGKYDKAFKGYNNLYTENKKGEYATKSLYWGINILYLQNKYSEVIDKSKEFNIEYPKSDYLADVNFYRADSYFKLNDTKNAAKTYIELYQKTTDKNIKDKTARELTTLYYNIEDYKNANIWKEKMSNPSEKTYLSALIYEKQGKSDLAIGEYQKIVDDKDYGSRANFNLASNYYKEKNYDKAKIHYEKILQIENGQYKDTATYQMGQIYMTKKDYSKALRNFMKIELLYTESPLKEPSKLKIAKIYEVQKEDEKAKKTYVEFYKDYPQSKYKGLVLEKLVVINLNEDKKDEAKKYYTELVKVNGEVAKNYESYFK